MMNWTEAYREHYPKALAYARSLSKNDAEDLTQEAFTQLLLRAVPENVQGFWRRRIKFLWMDGLRARRSAWRAWRETLTVERHGSTYMEPVQDERGLVSVRRCRKKATGKEVRFGKGGVLPVETCRFCGESYKPTVTRHKVRKATCGNPSCVARLAHQTKRLKRERVQV